MQEGNGEKSIRFVRNIALKSALQQDVGRYLGNFSLKINHINRNGSFRQCVSMPLTRGQEANETEYRKNY